MNGIEIYDSRQKESHRGWAWNRIAERTARPSDACGLYLSGPDDIDRQIAIRKGFRTENLIAVDIKPERIAGVRKDGGIGISDNIDNILLAWNDKPLDFLFLDSCSTVFTCLEIYAHGRESGAINNNTILYVNMQRGREPRNADTIQYLNRRFSDHRGRWFYGILESLWADQSDVLLLDIPTRHQVFIGHCLPQLATYRSRRVTMDSIVMRAAPRICDIAYQLAVGVRGLQAPKTMKDCRRILAEARRGGDIVRVSKKTKQRLAALKAIRARKILLTTNPQ